MIPSLFRNLCPSVNRKTPIFCEARAQHISWGQVFYPYTIHMHSTSLSFPHSVPHFLALFPCSVPSSIFQSSDPSVFQCIRHLICTSLTCAKHQPTNQIPLTESIWWYQTILWYLATKTIDPSSALRSDPVRFLHVFLQDRDQTGPRSFQNPKKPDRNR